MDGRPGAVEYSRVRAESWRLAAAIAHREPEVLIDPLGGPADGEGLVLHRSCGGGSAVTLTARSGVRATTTVGARTWTWKSVFKHSTNSIVAASIDFVQWSQSSSSIVMSPAAAAYAAIAAVFDVAGSSIDNTIVRNRLESESGPNRSYLLPLHPFPTAIADAEDEFAGTLMGGGTLRPTRWWLVSQWGMPRAAIDDLRGVVHTTTGRLVLPQGEGVLGRERIFEIMLSRVKTPA